MTSSPNSTYDIDTIYPLPSLLPATTAKTIFVVGENQGHIRMAHPFSHCTPNWMAPKQDNGPPRPSMVDWAPTIPKPRGQAGSPGRRGYRLETALRRDHQGYYSALQVCKILKLMQATGVDHDTEIYSPASSTLPGHENPYKGDDNYKATPTCSFRHIR